MKPYLESHYPIFPWGQIFKCCFLLLMVVLLFLGAVHLKGLEDELADQKALNRELGADLERLRANIGGGWPLEL